MFDPQQPLVIFTDLDGSLLDSHSYDWQPAALWLMRLKQQHVPVILCSSKTAAEMLLIQKEIGLEGRPFIAENGAVIQLDAQWRDDESWPRLIKGAPHAEILSVLQHLRERDGYKFTTISDVDEQVFSEWTGLDHKHAALARLQEASETLIWRDSDERMAAFSAKLQQLGLRFIQGARFWHVLDEQSGKAQAVSFLRRRMLQREGHDRLAIGLGDGPNDAELLDATDYAVVIKSLSRAGVQLQNDDPQRVYHTEQRGPHGWSEGINHFLGG
ncbi:mannosyl-3-phosphoglycerate phosphatase-related protein [Pseudocitrobacter cyperus]|uniref:Mannosyl-3-phosphoglycerate phosphatase-related protein n=1 Tax=Pseudocitrobacter cyperus TaxID=3112843 RepID=A0ABV0HLE1_9ENTR